MSTRTTFSNYTLGNANLANRLVMAPMTRSRAINNIPNELMAAYYAQRASAGLIVTEGVSPSPNGLGYARIPGLFSHGRGERLAAGNEGSTRKRRKNLCSTDAHRGELFTR